MKDYDVIDRRELEVLIIELKRSHLHLNQEIIKAQEAGGSELVCLYRGQYGATNQVIEKLTALLKIPFDDLVTGVVNFRFDKEMVISQLELEQLDNSGREVSSELFAEMLIATWRKEECSNPEFLNFKLLQRRILSNDKNHWALVSNYGISSDLGRSIVDSWKKEYASPIVIGSLASDKLKSELRQLYNSNLIAMQQIVFKDDYDSNMKRSYYIAQNERISALLKDS